MKDDISIDKICCDCDEAKLLVEFNKDKYNNDGLSYRCKACQKIKSSIAWKKQYEKQLSLLPKVKICNHCNMEKSREEFKITKKTNDGLFDNCNTCTKILYKEDQFKKAKERDLKKKQNIKCVQCNVVLGGENKHILRKQYKELCKNCVNNIKIHCNLCDEDHGFFDFYNQKQGLYKLYDTCKNCREGVRNRKICNGCNISKDISEFRDYNRLYHICNSCIEEYNKEKRIKNEKKRELLGLEPRFYDTKRFIKKAIETHGNKYDYSLTEYDPYEVEIICPKHGKFKQSPRSHLQGTDCYFCGIDVGTFKRRKNINDFIYEANKVHNNRYDYSKVNYTNGLTKVEIICDIHGSFYQLPKSHIKSIGCPKCGVESRAKKRALPFEEFYMRSKEKYGDNFIFDEDDYKNSHTEMNFICKRHGSLTKTPYMHLVYGCIDCNVEDSREEKQKSLIKNLKNKYGDSFNFSNIKYKNSQTKIEIVCDKHGPIYLLSNNALANIKCNGCATDEKINLSKEIISKNDGKYLNFVDNKIEIKCNSGHIFNLTFDKLKYGRWCPHCLHKTETKCREYLERYIGHNFKKIRPDWLKNPKTGHRLELDGYCEDLNLAFEYNGSYHYKLNIHNNFKSNKLLEIQKRDKFKLKKCKEKGIKLIVLKDLDYSQDKDIEFAVHNKLKEINLV